MKPRTVPPATSPTLGQHALDAPERPLVPPAWPRTVADLVRGLAGGGWALHEVAPGRGRLVCGWTGQAAPLPDEMYWTLRLAGFLTCADATRQALTVGAMRYIGVVPDPAGLPAHVEAAIAAVDNACPDFTPPAPTAPAAAAIWSVLSGSLDHAPACTGQPCTCGLTAACGIIQAAASGWRPDPSL